MTEQTDAPVALAQKFPVLRGVVAGVGAVVAFLVSLVFGTVLVLTVLAVLAVFAPDPRWRPYCVKTVLAAAATFGVLFLALAVWGGFIGS